MKRSAYLGSLLVFVALAAGAAGEVTVRDHRTTSNVQVRDHRQSAQGTSTISTTSAPGGVTVTQGAKRRASGGGLLDSITGAAGSAAGAVGSAVGSAGKAVSGAASGVKNGVEGVLGLGGSNSSSQPVVRDHRNTSNVVIRDHRNGGTVVIRDHRDKTGTAVPPWTIPPVVKPPVVKPPVADPVTPPADGGSQPPADPQPPSNPQPPKNDHGKPKFPWWQVVGGLVQPRVRPVVINRPVVVQSPVTQATYHEPALAQLPAGSAAKISGDFGATQGQAAFRYGDMMLAVEILDWQPNAVTVRLPMAYVAKPITAQIIIARADGTLARQTSFVMVSAQAN